MAVENIPIYSNINAGTKNHTYFSQSVPHPIFVSWPANAKQTSSTDGVLATENLNYIVTEDGNYIAIESNGAYLGTQNANFIVTENGNYLMVR
jgi:hypothetical protein